MKLRKVFMAITLLLMLVVASLATGCFSWHGGDRDRGRGRDMDRGGERSQDQGSRESRGGENERPR
jgi:hypothetical protein